MNVEVGDMQTLTVATWNVARRQGWQSALSSSQTPDVLFLQEVKNPESLELDGWHVIGSSINERGRKESWGNAILSRLELIEVKLSTEYKGSLCFAAVSLGSELIGLVNIYGLLEPSPMQPKQKFVHYGLHRMLSDIGFWLAGLEEPKVSGFVVGGDLNKDRKMDGGGGFKSGRSIASNLLNRFDDFGLKEVSPEQSPTYKHSSGSLWQIDHLFVSSKFKYSVMNDLGARLNPEFTHSDHQPLGVEIVR